MEVKLIEEAQFPGLLLYVLHVRGLFQLGEDSLDAFIVVLWRRFNVRLGC